MARPLLLQFLALYPTPEALSAAHRQDVEEFMQPLGLFRIRAERMIKMAQEWVARPPARGKETVLYNYPPRDTKPFPIPNREPCGVPQKMGWEVAHLSGVGAYALDSWRIFCRDRLREVGGPAKDEKAAAAEEEEEEEEEEGEGEEEEEAEWKRVVSKDKELRAYLRWRWAKEGVRWHEEDDDAFSNMADV